MSGPAKKRATYQDVLEAPPNMLAEVLLGELRLSPRPARRHGRAASTLGMELGGAFDRGRSGPGGWVIFDEPELHLGEDILVPDLGGWRKERFPVGADEEAYFLTPPDWVCEVLSPSTARYDRTDKLFIYARERIPFLWLVDPRERTLECYVLDDSAWKLVGSYRDDALVQAPPFEVFTLELAALWLVEA